MDILVGVDESERGLAALESAIARARESGDDLTIAVYSESASVGQVETRVRDRLDALGFEASIERLEHNPGGLLVQEAETGDYDRIVLPGGKRSPLGKITFDSTVEFVLLNARTTVTLVR